MFQLQNNFILNTLNYFITKSPPNVFKKLLNEFQFMNAKLGWASTWTLKAISLWAIVRTLLSLSCIAAFNTFGHVMLYTKTDNRFGIEIRNILRVNNANANKKQIEGRKRQQTYLKLNMKMITRYVGWCYTCFGFFFQVGFVNVLNLNSIF